MDNNFVIEGISSVSAVINNTLERRSNSTKRLTTVYFDISKVSKYDKNNYARYKFLKENAAKAGYTFKELSNDEFSKIVTGKTHGGVAAECTDSDIEPLSVQKIKENSFYCYLDGVDDPFNLGYIIRSMYLFGAAGIILPENNKLKGFPATVIRSSAGTTEFIDIYSVSSPVALCEIFKERDYKIVCTSLRDSVSTYEADLTCPLLLVIGGEKRGISSTILSQSDVNVKIDYSIPFNGSLPSVCAASVLGYEIQRQNASK